MTTHTAPSEEATRFRAPHHGGWESAGTVDRKDPVTPPHQPPLFGSSTSPIGGELAAQWGGTPQAQVVPTPATADTQFAAPVDESPQAEIRRELARILRMAELVTFEDGVRNAFSDSLECLFHEHGSDAAWELWGLLRSGRVHPDVAEQALYGIGRSEDARSLVGRRSVLIRALFHVSSSLRAASVVGFSLLEDPTSIRPLAAVLQRETEPWIANDIKRVIEIHERITQGTNAPPSP